MNGIIGLCHFCELHGPVILYHTQTLPTEKKDELIKSIQSGASCKSTPTCQACQSLHDDEERVLMSDEEVSSYVSCEFPPQSELHTALRQAAVRSLSCEVCPGKEGAIYFGDNARGHVISYTFFVHDSQARGFQRWYSIVILMRDQIYLLTLWHFLVDLIKDIVKQIQQSALKVYSEEQAKCSVRALRLNTLTLPQPESNGSSKPASSKLPPRPLTQLTANPKLYIKLHEQFSFILRAGGKRLVTVKPDSILPEDSFSPVVVGSGRLARMLEKLINIDDLYKVIHHIQLQHNVCIVGDPVGASELIGGFKAFIPPGFPCSATYASAEDGTRDDVKVLIYVTLHTTHKYKVKVKFLEVYRMYPVLEMGLEPLEVTYPTVTLKMISSVKSRVEDHVLDQLLSTLSKEWVGKARTFSAAVNQLSSNQLPAAGLSKQHKLLQALNGKDEDLPLLKAWATPS